MRRLSALALLVAGCGRTPTIEPALLLVEVVDGADNPIDSAAVELRDGGALVDTRATDGDGIATFRWPGEGRYSLFAANDPQCCWGEGTLDVVLSEPNELVVVEMTIGPCPTWSPPSC